MILLVSLVARGAVPLGIYPDCAQDRPDLCPPELVGDWSMIGWIPAGSVDTIRPAELALGSGIAADVAFRHTTGRWDAIVAVLDSGIYWQEDDLWSKIHLNAGELPLPQGADGVESADVDGNGILNLDDWRSDPRVLPTAGQDAADLVLDPSDLIYTFSDGVDDDGNGYVDDIAGWDFFAGDNDPFADPQVGYADHGTGVMDEAAEPGGDDSGIGVCPNCAILPVRVGDTFVTHGDNVGSALVFAADSGAKGAALAIGALTMPSWAYDAIRYADGQGVTIVGAAGDENSYHRNYPAAADEILYVHSITSDSDDSNNGAYSYFNTWNCNNFGPRMDLVAPSGACATGAVAKMAGAAALVWSAGQDAGDDLAPVEIRQLLTASADDIWLTDAEREESGAYPSREGWDSFYGYGRANIGRSVEAVVGAGIPPIARIDSPTWFAWAGDGAGVEISATIQAPRAAVDGWVLEIGAGADPTAWTEVARGDGPAEGPIATVDLPLSTGDLAVPAQEGVVDRMARAHDRLVQLRLTVTDTAGNAAVARSGVWVDADPDLLPGFPLVTGSSMESSVTLAQLDATPAWEIVFASSNGSIHAVNGAGAELPGFPVWTELLPQADSAGWRSGEIPAPHEGVISGVAVGDLDGDGDGEIVAAGLAGQVYAWNADGTPVAGFPVSTVGRAAEERTANTHWDDGVAAAPALGDIDGDGALEIVVPAMDQRLYVWRGDGTTYPGYPLEICQPELCGVAGTRIIAPVALGDIDDDGDLDAALGTNEVPVGAAGLLYLVDLPAARIWDGYPLGQRGLVNETVLPLIGEGHPAAVSLADLDGDGTLEISSNPMLGSLGPIHADGTDAIPVSMVATGFGPGTDFNEGSMLAAVNDPTFADITGDGTPDFLTGGVGVNWLVSLAFTKELDYQHAVGAWDGVTGAGIPGFPRKIEDIAFLAAPTVADVSGDGAQDVLGASGGGLVHAWSGDGKPVPGWPKLTGGWMLGGPSIGDVDGDGDLDVVVGTRDGLVFAWGTPGDAAQALQWPMNRHDPANTGNWHTELARQPGLPAVADADEKGCGCATGAPAPLAGILLAVLALARRRR